MTRQAPLRVAVIGPPLSASGGIGRVMSYTFSALRGQTHVQFRVLDTRGLRSSPWFSFLPLLRACATLLMLSVRGQVDVAHINISSHGSVLRKGVAVRVCRMARIPVVLHLHASSFSEFFSPLPGWAKSWVRHTFGLAERVVVLGQVWRSYAQDVLGVPAERVAVLPNATPPAAAPGSSRLEGEPLRIVFLGRLGARKGLPELLEALADPRLRDHAWSATVAGDGDLDTYRARAVELGLEARLEFLGWVSGDAVHEILASSHVLVLPSHAEGLPMSVLEAFAAGVPVVCTPVGGLAEVVVDGGNGLLVPPGDVAALSEAILRLLQDESLRLRLAARALSTWQRDHSIDAYASRLVLEWQVAAKRGPGTTGESSQLSAVSG